MEKKKLNLLNDFAKASDEQWLEVVTRDLKGADFERKLVWRTKEGINVQPFYRAKDIDGLKITDLQPNVFPYLRGTKTNNDWYIRQNINAKDP
ncbi:MAG: methylmalonyl-CoA mutase small subunit, partial [Paludibacter sp.]